MKKNKTWKDFAITTPAAEGISYFSAQTGKVTVVSFFFFIFGQVTRPELMGTCAWQSRVKKTTNRDKKKKKRLFSFPFYFWRIACEFSFWWKNRNENTFDNVLTEGAILSTRTARKYISIYNVVYVIVVMYCTWNVHKNPSVQVVTPSFKLTDNKTKVTLLLATT